jgi:hypothetical protein
VCYSVFVYAIISVHANVMSVFVCVSVCASGYQFYVSMCDLHIHSVVYVLVFVCVIVHVN